MANIIKAFATIITVGHPLRKSFEIVLEYTHNSFLLPVDGSDDCNDLGKNKQDDAETDGALSENNDNNGPVELLTNAKAHFQDILQHLHEELEVEQEGAHRLCRNKYLFGLRLMHWTKI